MKNRCILHGRIFVMRQVQDQLIRQTLLREFPLAIFCKIKGFPKTIIFSKWAQTWKLQASLNPTSVGICLNAF